jgi:ribosomal protein L7/L12
LPRSLTGARARHYNEQMEFLYIIAAALITVALYFILARLLSRRPKDTKKAPGPQSGKAVRVPEVGDTLEQQVARLLTQGGKMEAIKLMREKTGLGLAEAKAAVEAIGKDAAIVAPAPGLQATIRRALEMSDEVQHLVAQGQKIEAIKLIRERTGLGLKEAKDLVDRLG